MLKEKSHSRLSTAAGVIKKESTTELVYPIIQQSDPGIFFFFWSNRYTQAGVLGIRIWDHGIHCLCTYLISQHCQHKTVNSRHTSVAQQYFVLAIGIGVLANVGCHIKSECNDKVGTHKLHWPPKNYGKSLNNDVVPSVISAYYTSMHQTSTRIPRWCQIPSCPLIK